MTWKTFGSCDMDNLVILRSSNPRYDPYETRLQSEKLCLQFNKSTLVTNSYCLIRPNTCIMTGRRAFGSG